MEEEQSSIEDVVGGESEVEEEISSPSPTTEEENSPPPPAVETEEAATDEEVTPVQEADVVDPLSMSDEDFEIFMDKQEEDIPVKEEEKKEPEKDEKVVKVEEETESLKEEKAPEIDYKAEYEKIMAPFKANGIKMQLNNAEDVIKLNQKGINYDVKMKTIKPHLKLIKMLENNDLLEEEKLNYLIDLSKNNPKAITKLIKDAEVDPLDIDLEENTNYTPTNHGVSDKEMELDTVLSEIESTESFQRTSGIISEEWDATSKQELIQDPRLLRLINEQVGNGVYDTINYVVQREKLLGNLQGLSDIEAYKQVGDVIQANGGFNRQADSDKTENANANVNAPAADDTQSVNNVERMAKLKRAASPTKANNVSNQIQPKVNDPLSMSDDEFEKYYNQL